MKKGLNSLFILILTLGVILPTLVYAEREEKKETTKVVETIKEPVNVYLFRGEGCPYCEEAIEWFNSTSVQKKYGKYFKLIKYQVWPIDGDEEATMVANTNYQLMEVVGHTLSADASGIPFIVIGKNAYSGFDANDAQTLIDYIMEEYNKPVDERIETIPFVENYTEIKGIPDSEPSEVETNLKNLLIAISLIVIVLYF